LLNLLCFQIAFAIMGMDFATSPETTGSPSQKLDLGCETDFPQPQTGCIFSPRAQTQQGREAFPPLGSAKWAAHSTFIKNIRLQV